MKKRKIDSTRHLKNIEDAAKEVATWSQAKIDNARLAFSEPMPKKPSSETEVQEKSVNGDRAVSKEYFES